MQLQYDPETQQWSYVNVAQTFIDTSTFSSTDPQFQYGSDNQQDDNDDDDATTDPCPAGYRLVVLEDGSSTCERIEAPAQDSGGREDTPEPPKPDPFAQNKESIESFFELKNEGKIDFNTYNSKTNLVEYNSNPNETTLGQLAKAFVTGVGAIEFIDNAMDESELKRAGMLVEGEDGKKFINLRAVHDVMKTKVMNPGVPEGNVLANTPSYYGLDDTNNYYKNYLENMNIKKEDMKIFGSTDVGIIFDEMMKSENKFKTTKLSNQGFETFGNSYFFNGKRLDQAEVNRLIQSGVTNPNDIANEIKKDESKYIVTKQETKTDSDSGGDEGDPVFIGDPGEEAEKGDSSGPGTPGYVAPGTGKTGAPGRNYENIQEFPEAPDVNRRRRQLNNQRFTKASQDAARSKQQTLKKKAKYGTMGSGGAFPGQKGGGAPGYN